MHFLLAGGIVTALFLGILGPADAALQEGRSVGTCSPQMLVCAFMKDGTAASMSECRAQATDALRIVPGDCEDAD